MIGGRCRTCRHWVKNGTERWGYKQPSRDSYRTCVAVPFFCDPEALNARAVVKDGSGYTGSLLTRFDFGCILHDLRLPGHKSKGGRDGST